MASPKEVLQMGVASSPSYSTSGILYLYEEVQRFSSSISSIATEMVTGEKYPSSSGIKGLSSRAESQKGLEH